MKYKKRENIISTIILLIASYLVIDFLGIKNALVGYSIDYIIIYLTFIKYIKESNDIHWTKTLLLNSIYISICYFIFKVIEITTVNINFINDILYEAQNESANYGLNKEQTELNINFLKKIITPTSFSIFVLIGVYINCVCIVWFLKIQNKFKAIGKGVKI
jgi:hypothetical protein